MLLLTGKSAAPTVREHRGTNCLACTHGWTLRCWMVAITLAAYVLELACFSKLAIPPYLLNFQQIALLVVVVDPHLAGGAGSDHPRFLTPLSTHCRIGQFSAACLVE